MTAMSWRRCRPGAIGSGRLAPLACDRAGVTPVGLVADFF